MFDFIAAGPGWPPLALSAARSGVTASRRITVDVPDMTCGDRVLELFERCRGLFRDGGRHVVIDLGSVTHADTKIVACLVVLYQIAHGASVTLEVRLSHAVVEIATVCRLDALVRELAQKPALEQEP